MAETFGPRLAADTSFSQKTAPDISRRDALTRFAAGAVLLTGWGSSAEADDGSASVSTEHITNTDGTLFISGGCITEEMRDVYLNFAKKTSTEKPSIVIVTTGDEKPNKGVLSDYWHGDENAAAYSLMHAESPEEADSETFCTPLKTADGVWFVGGDQTRYEKAYGNKEGKKENRFRTELKNVLRRGGIVGGISAGAAVMSYKMIRGGRTVSEQGLGEGFALLPTKKGVIEQHLNRAWRADRMRSLGPDFVGIGIPDYAALVVQKNIARIIGEGRVKICMPDWQTAGFREFEPGDQFDLQTFQRVPTLPIDSEQPARSVAVAQAGEE